MTEDVRLVRGRTGSFDPKPPAVVTRAGGRVGGICPCHPDTYTYCGTSRTPPTKPSFSLELYGGPARVPRSRRVRCSHPVRPEKRLEVPLSTVSGPRVGVTTCSPGLL